MNQLLARGYDWLLWKLGFTGDFSRFTFDPNHVDLLAVALVDGAKHTGVVYRNVADELRFLNFPYHDQALRNDKGSGQMAYAVPLLKEEDMKFLAGYCELVHIANQNKKLPYSFEFDPNLGFDRNTGLIVINFDRGFTCSTFVVAFFRSAGNPLVQHNTWPRWGGPADIAERQHLLEMWRNSGRAELIARVDEIEPTIRTMRISPQQVAGACLQRNLPTGYYCASENGREMRQRITDRFGPLTS